MVIWFCVHTVSSYNWTIASWIFCYISPCIPLRGKIKGTAVCLYPVDTHLGSIWLCKLLFIGLIWFRYFLKWAYCSISNPLMSWQYNTAIFTRSHCSPDRLDRPLGFLPRGLSNLSISHVPCWKVVQPLQLCTYVCTFSTMYWHIASTVCKCRCTCILAYMVY